MQKPSSIAGTVFGFIGILFTVSGYILGGQDSFQYTVLEWLVTALLNFVIFYVLGYWIIRGYIKVRK